MSSGVLEEEDVKVIFERRNGRADPRAEWQMPVLVDLARMNFSG